MNRGVLTDELKAKYDISLKELRLIPYFQYLIVNNAPVDRRKIDEEERGILQKWRDAGRITFSCTEPCTCTREFWNWMSDILWDSYVPQKESNEEELDKSTNDALSQIFVGMCKAKTDNADLSQVITCEMQDGTVRDVNVTMHIELTKAEILDKDKENNKEEKE